MHSTYPIRRLNKEVQRRADTSSLEVEDGGGAHRHGHAGLRSSAFEDRPHGLANLHELVGDVINNVAAVEFLGTRQYEQCFG